MANEGRQRNADWDGIWIVTRGQRRAGLQKSALLRSSSTERKTQTWGLNFERKVRRLNEDSFWSPMPRIYDVKRVSLAGTVEGMRGLRAGKKLRFKPYAAGSSNSIGLSGTAAISTRASTSSTESQPDWSGTSPSTRISPGRNDDQQVN